MRKADSLINRSLKSTSSMREADKDPKVVAQMLKDKLNPDVIGMNVMNEVGTSFGIRLGLGSVRGLIFQSRGIHPPDNAFSSIVETYWVEVRMWDVSKETYGEVLYYGPVSMTYKAIGGGSNGGEMYLGGRQAYVEVKPDGSVRVITK